MTSTGFVITCEVTLKQNVYLIFNLLVTCNDKIQSTPNVPLGAFLLPVIYHRFYSDGNGIAMQ